MVHLPPIVEMPLASPSSATAISPAAPHAQWVWADEAATAQWAQCMAQLAWLQHATLALVGDLGAGKTTFVRHLLKSLGVQGRIKSPTFAVVEPHEARTPQGQPLSVWHFDFYRFDDPREWEDAGFRDLFAAPGLKLAEWPQKAQGVMPTPDWTLTLTPSPQDDQPDRRTVSVQAHTPRGQAGLSALQQAWPSLPAPSGTADLGAGA